MDYALSNNIVAQTNAIARNCFAQKSIAVPRVALAKTFTLSDHTLTCSLPAHEVRVIADFRADAQCVVLSSLDADSTPISRVTQDIKKNDCDMPGESAATVGGIRAYCANVPLGARDLAHITVARVSARDIVAPVRITGIYAQDTHECAPILCSGIVVLEDARTCAGQTRTYLAYPGSIALVQANGAEHIIARCARTFISDGISWLII